MISYVLWKSVEVAFCHISPYSSKLGSFLSTNADLPISILYKSILSLLAYTFLPNAIRSFKCIFAYSNMTSYEILSNSPHHLCLPQHLPLLSPLPPVLCRHPSFFLCHAAGSHPSLSRTLREIPSWSGISKSDKGRQGQHEVRHKIHFR